MGRPAEGRAKDPNEMRVGDIGDARQLRDVERLRVVAIHRVTHAQHVTVRPFDGSAHAGPGSVSIVASTPGESDRTWLAGTNPLPFDSGYQPKPAWDALMRALR